MDANFDKLDGGSSGSIGGGGGNSDSSNSTPTEPQDIKPQDQEIGRAHV